ncbi:hypothetical protein [Aquabacterium humicola]|uniref:hypothetical protein n=1 Tax=Aquabacterium humicola TaxID=3237377 RepID=UPI00254369C0|nr:hypothetical protein [Rubrivivax pictus]
MSDPHPAAQAMLDHLFALETAAQRRCDASAARIDSGPMNALLLLHSAAHRGNAQRLSDAVVLLCGTPPSGLTDTLASDPAGPGFPAGDHGIDALLDACIAEDRQAAEAYQRAIAHDAAGGWRWPEGVPVILEAGLRSNEARCRELIDAKAAGERPRGAAARAEPSGDAPAP